jgi:hypothetical protein
MSREDHNPIQAAQFAMAFTVVTALRMAMQSTGVHVTEAAGGGIKKKKVAPAKASRKAKGSPKQAEAAPVTKVETESPKPEENKDYSAHYLIKSEPGDYSVDDLDSEPGKTTCWGALCPSGASRV